MTAPQIEHMQRFESDSMQNGPIQLCFVLPVFNDWAGIPRLLQELASLLPPHVARAHVFLVDDGSNDPGKDLRCKDLGGSISVTIIRLRRNFGHQRAIAIGLAYVASHCSNADAVIGMDCDGEDVPRDIPRMIERLRADRTLGAVFAKRGRRSEPIWFRLAYLCYKLWFFILTGRRIFFGNFSVLSRGGLHRIIWCSELWKHYAAAVMKSNLRWSSIKSDRGTRIAGRSSMNLTSLIIHGFSAVSVFSDSVVVRIMVAAISAICPTLIGFAVLFGIKVFTSLAIPGWTSTLILLLFAILFQVLSSALVLIILLLNNRSVEEVVPALHAEKFISSVDQPGGAL